MDARLQALLEKTVTGLGYELWGLEFRSYGNSALLRVYIEHENGIGIDDCVQVSEQLGAVLDVEDLIAVAYQLEVSSPGIDRVLFKPAHYQMVEGGNLKVKTHTAVDGRRNFRGQLVAADENEITMKVDGVEYTIPYAAIDRGRLQFDFKTSPKQRRSGVGS